MEVIAHGIHQIALERPFDASRAIFLIYGSPRSSIIFSAMDHGYVNRMIQIPAVISDYFFTGSHVIHLANQERVLETNIVFLVEQPHVIRLGANSIPCGSVYSERILVFIVQRTIHQLATIVLVRVGLREWNGEYGFVGILVVRREIGSEVRLYDIAHAHDLVAALDYFLIRVIALESPSIGIQVQHR